MADFQEEVTQPPEGGEPDLSAAAAPSGLRRLTSPVYVGAALTLATCGLIDFSLRHFHKPGGGTDPHGEKSGSRPGLTATNNLESPHRGHKPNAE